MVRRLYLIAFGPSIFLMASWLLPNAVLAHLGMTWISALVLFLLFTPIIPGAFLALLAEDRLGELASDHWERVKDAVVSPARERAGELSGFANRLNASVTAAEETLIEVESAFRGLETEIAFRQDELSAAIKSLEQSRTVAAQNQEAVDALLAAWADKQRVELELAERRGRRFDIVLAFVGLLLSLVAGYVLGALLPPETFRRALGR